MTLQYASDRLRSNKEAGRLRELCSVQGCSTFTTEFKLGVSLQNCGVITCPDSAPDPGIVKRGLNALAEPPSSSEA